MSDHKKAALYGVDSLLKAGVDKAECRLWVAEKHEMNVDQGELSLLRTTFDTRLSLTAIEDGKKGGTVINQSDQGSIDKAVSDVVAIAQASRPDDANDISEKQEPARFSSGAESPDLDKMHYRLKELIGDIRSRYPKIVFRQAYLDFTHARDYLVNSNGADLASTKGVYRCTLIFSGKEGENVSSFNYTGFALPDLEGPLIDHGSIDRLMGQSEEQIFTKPVAGKFVGDVIIAPDSLRGMFGFLLRSIGDGAMISGTSIYKDSLNKPVASPLLTLHSRPVSEEICDGYFITSDGYAAQNSTIVDKGTLLTFLLSLYGAKKTGGKRAVNSGGAFVVEPGDTSYEDMVKSVKRGVLLTRFSGGSPSSDGGFSGVAKNSYLIEDGELKYPISETMLSGNFAEMLRNISAISRERVDYGNSILPWVLVPGVTISGK